MLQRSLESGWGVLISGAVVAALVFNGLTFGEWRLLMASAMVTTIGMLFHRRLRHFMLLPSCIALASGIALLALSLGMLTER
ncbi:MULTISPECIES: DUF1435 domain-containing protein [Tenebrionibacter/Tenebrionicola group]|jgi:uncharacterized membrane protein YjjP (DUF1212 family)|uniref:DUF1435 domain-containing protein n=2 Tax=Tenebrionibacter/Tenebrionicola group TaxID=2969848 RepID=A0A8K0V4P0_9ENTR|nr:MULTISPECIES: DUF1435 domain-containing protein [Tenebrionibacter/Tenebrionicola group]MBK4715656.1 DUF1435 domain-containing protein [Tenebrionibacter intestinalis]MBV5096409.1 DUF1435 domain-containing protein [Tenebrionicola larvae]